MKKINTLTFNDISISYGPNIHYIELWNEFNSISKNEFQINGLCGNWKNASPITNLNFHLKRFHVPDIPKVRQMILDVYFSMYIIQHRNEIFYLRLSNYSLLVWLTLLLFKVRYFIELNGIMEKDTKLFKMGNINSFYAALQERILINGCRGCIAVTSQIEQFARSKKAKRIITIPNGVSNSFFDIKQKKESGYDFVFVGSFTPWDGLALIIELAKEYKEATFHLIGDGVSRSEIERNKTENMKFYGTISYNELLTLYPKFDAGIALYLSQESDKQLSSLKTIEYIASGLPVFTSTALGQEFVEHNTLGVCSKLENVLLDFSKFMSNMKVYKSNVEHFRTIEKENMSWARVALKTKEFINKSI